MYQLAAVALEENLPFWRAKEVTVVWKIPSGVQLSFHSYLGLRVGNLLQTDLLGCNMPTMPRWAFCCMVSQCHRCICRSRTDGPRSKSGASRRKAMLNKSTAMCWTVTCIFCTEGFQQTGYPTQTLMLLTGAPLADSWWSQPIFPII